MTTLNQLKEQVELIALFSGCTQRPVVASTPGSAVKYRDMREMENGWVRGDSFVCEDGTVITEADAEKYSDTILLLYQGSTEHPQPIAVDVKAYLKAKRSLN